MNRKMRMISAAIAMLALSPTARAEPGSSASESDFALPAPSHRSGIFGGVRLSYVATPSFTSLRDDQGVEAAKIFSVAYVKSGTPATNRPVTFVFNGGPGTSSMFLHIGFAGPKKAAVPGDATGAGNAPFNLLDNPDSILDATDLVFVDPVGTGYSTTVGSGKNRDYWGVKQDARAITQFIRLWLQQNDRFNSPRFLLGESYGTTRAVQIVQEMKSALTGAMPNGVILVSSVLDFQTMVTSPGNDVPFMTYLPTYAATAAYHGKAIPVGGDRAQFLMDARCFAIGEYSVALLKGNKLEASEREHIAERLAYFTGLSKSYVLSADLRVKPDQFRKELLRSEGKIVGSLDGRYSSPDSDGSAAEARFDPSSAAIENAYVSTFSTYLTRDLGIRLPQPYRFYNREVSQNWIWTEPTRQPSAVDIADIVGETMHENPSFRALVASGEYDFSTPIFASELTFARHGINPAQTVMKEYPAGHMVYTHSASAGALAADIRVFIRSGLANAK